jgi:hypothetical protein
MSGSPVSGDIRLFGVRFGGNVIPPVEASPSESAAALAASAASADIPVSDDARNVGGDPVVTPSHSDRHNAERAEHERQSRLRRWQAVTR